MKTEIVRTFFLARFKEFIEREPPATATARPIRQR
jgi:hypothetical protein